MTITEADIEFAVLDWLAALGWQVAHGRAIASDTPGAERGDYGQVVLEGRLLRVAGERLQQAAHEDNDGIG